MNEENLNNSDSQQLNAAGERDIYQELRVIGLTHDQCSDVMNLIDTLPKQIREGIDNTKVSVSNGAITVEPNLEEKKLNDTKLVLREALDWIDEFAKVATKKQLKQERRNLIKNKNVIENYEFKLNKLDKYIGDKI